MQVVLLCFVANALSSKQQQQPQHLTGSIVMRQIHWEESWETRVEKHNIFTFQIRIKTHFKIQDTPWHIIKFALHQHIKLSCFPVMAWPGMVRAGLPVWFGFPWFNSTHPCPMFVNSVKITPSFTISCYFTLVFYFYVVSLYLPVWIRRMDTGGKRCATGRNVLCCIMRHL